MLQYPVNWVEVYGVDEVVIEIFVVERPLLSSQRHELKAAPTTDEIQRGLDLCNFREVAEH